MVGVKVAASGMQLVLQAILWIVGLGLQFLLLSSLVSGPLREYAAVFVYSVVLFFTTVIEIIAASDKGQITRTWSQVFWICEFVRQAALYAVVISFVVQAVQEERKRVPVRNALTLIALVFWSGSFYVQRNPNVELWMTNAFRNLSFCLALANLALWFALIASHKRDDRLLTVTGGLGIQMTGEAIAQTLRQLSPVTWHIGNFVGVAAHFLCLYIWWQAFAKMNARRVAAPGVITSNH